MTKPESLIWCFYRVVGSNWTSCSVIVPAALVLGDNSTSRAITAQKERQLRIKGDGVKNAGIIGYGERGQNAIARLTQRASTTRL